MTSTFAPFATASRGSARARAGVHALVVVVTPMQGVLVLPPRRPGPGRP